MTNKRVIRKIRTSFIVFILVFHVELRCVNDFGQHLAVYFVLKRFNIYFAQCDRLLALHTLQPQSKMIFIL